MSLTKYLPHENPSYDELFLKASKREPHKYGLAQTSTQKVQPFFWKLRHQGGMIFQNNLIVYESVLKILCKTDPVLCKQILEDQVATVGLKTTARLAAQIGVDLNAEVIYQKLPAWMKKLRELQASKNIVEECVAPRELGLGLYTVAGLFDNTLIQLILQADTDYKRKYVKRYLALHPLSTADADALRAHREYRPEIERIWSVSDQPPERHCYLHNLISMAMSGTLCLDQLMGERTTGQSLDATNIIKMIMAQDHVVNLDAKAVVQVFSSDDINVGSGLNILLETSLRFHMRQNPTGLANRLAVALVKEMAEVLSTDHGGLPDAFNEGIDGPKIDGLASIVRAVVQAGFQGALGGIEALAELAVSRNQLDHKKLLRVLKLGIFNECRSVETQGFRDRADDDFFDRIQLQGAILQDGVTPRGQSEERLLCPGISLDDIPQVIVKPLGDIVCELIGNPFKNGQSMSDEELQKMIDIDVLRPQHITRIAKNEQALANFLKARVPKHLVEASELAMATNLANDLGL